MCNGLISSYFIKSRVSSIIRFPPSSNSKKSSSNTLFSPSRSFIRNLGTNRDTKTFKGSPFPREPLYSQSSHQSSTPSSGSSRGLVPYLSLSVRVLRPTSFLTYVDPGLLYITDFLFPLRHSCVYITGSLYPSDRGRNGLLHSSSGGPPQGLSLLLLFPFFVLPN